MRHPVVRLSFGSGNFKEPGYVHEDAMAQLDAIEEEASVAARYDTAPVRLRHLLQALHRRTGRRAVILVDEYDKPILDALEAPETARANRVFLRGLYAVIKDCDVNVRFTFLTRVSKSSKVSLFSGLNNCASCSPPTISTGSRCCSGHSSPPSPTTGTGGTRSLATRAATRACSTPTSPQRGWTWRWRTRASAGRWTWRCASTARLPPGVQGGRVGAGGGGDGAAQGPPLRGQVPRSR